MHTSNEKKDHNHLPILKKIPFAENVQQLHRYNMHVADVCFRSSTNNIENYHNNKERYHREVQSKIDERINAAAEKEQEKRKTLENKHKELKKRNLENLGKLDKFLAQKRQQTTKKEKKMMEESFLRRQQHLKTLTSSFHHSQDRRYHIKQRQSKQMERSLLLYEEHQKKLQAANNRRSEFLYDIKSMLKTQNDEILQAQQICKSREERKEQASWKKLIKKYEAADINQQTLKSIAQKRIENRKKQGQKIMQNHWKKRSNLEQQKEKLNEEWMKKQQQRIDRANNQKEKNMENVAQTIESKRKMKEKQLTLNTFYMQEDEEKRIARIYQKEHCSQIFLTTLKQEKERLHNQNLHDSLASTLRQ